jgi:lysophospholipase L1-like esterase
MTNRLTQSLLHSLAALALGCAVALLIGEGIARVAESRRTDYRETAVQTHRGALLWKLKAPMIEPEPKEIKDGFRILVVGDSYTWGDGVYPESTYPRGLAYRLEDYFGEPYVEVLSMARPGWNSKTQLEKVRGFFPHLEPDLVIVGVCLNDAEPSNRERMEEGIKPARRRQVESRVGKWAYASSALVRLVFEGFENLRSRIAVRRYYHSLYAADTGTRTGFQTAIRGFARFSRKSKIPIVMAIFPIFDSQLGDGYSYRALHEEIGSLAGDAGLRVLDLLPAYEGVDARRLALIPFTDPHPNELAHRLAAERIAEYLIAEELITPPEETEAGPVGSPGDNARSLGQGDS